MSIHYYFSDGFKLSEPNKAFRTTHSKNKLFRMVGQHTIDQGRGCTTLFRVADVERPLKIQTLKATDGQPGDSFGWAAAITDNGQFVAVGAPHAEDGRGVVYLYELPSGKFTFVEKQKLTLRKGVNSVNFGWLLNFTDSGKLVVNSINQFASTETILHNFEYDGTVFVETN